jgi:tetratricopeptide (TPR) repeat protein
MRWLNMVAVWSLVGGALFAQVPAKTSDELKAEAAQAQGLLDKQNYVAALPLYEDLHAQVPQNPYYTERLAAALLGQIGTQDAKGAATTRARAKQLLLQAQAGGDNSNLVQILLEQMSQGEQTGPGAPPAGQEWVDKGEAAFSKGDLPGALGFYKKALEVNPNNYGAALFAGDAEYKSGHAAEAGVWFARAIAINPDQETAYRYWGDTLEKNGEHKRAEEEFIAGIVAQPYQRAPRLGLKQWADKNHMTVLPPQVKLPPRGTVTPKEGGGINFTMTPPAKDDPEAQLATTYAVGAAIWQGGAFQRQFPQEKVYRHSLPEEAQTIRVMLGAAKKLPQDKLSASTKTLMALDAAGMLECWILLDHADQGIAQDYVAYRKEHRALMERYVAQWDVHAM